MKPEVKSIVALALLVVDGTLDTSVGLLKEKPIFLWVPGHSALESAPLDLRDTNTSKVLTERSLHFSWEIVVGKVDDRPSGIRLLHEHTARKDEGRNHYGREITHGCVLVAEPFIIRAQRPDIAILAGVFGQVSSSGLIP